MKFFVLNKSNMIKKVDLTNKKNHLNKRKKDNIIGISILIIMLIATFYLIIHSDEKIQKKNFKLQETKSREIKVDINTRKEVSDLLNYTSSQIKKEKASITIPGYTQLNFKANKKIQKVNFYNPQNNTCYFVLSLVLKNGTKIWQSSYLEPGRKFTQIELDKKLNKGIYKNTYLYYRTYDLVSKEEKNGSNIKLNLKVN